MSLLDGGYKQIVKSRSDVCRKIDDIGMNQFDEWADHCAGRQSQKLIFLWWFAHNCRGINGVPAARNATNMEHWKLRCFRIVTKVIAEGAFNPTFLRRDNAFENDLGTGGHAHA